MYSYLPLIYLIFTIASNIYLALDNGVNIYLDLSNISLHVQLFTFNLFNIYHYFKYLLTHGLKKVL